MTIKQISVFLENQSGRLDEVLKILAVNEVNIVAMTLADTADYGMLRLIVSDPARGVTVLKENGMMAKLVDVVAFHVPHATGSLYNAMKLMSDANINVEYMYAFGNTDDASAVLKTKKPKEAIELLEKNGVGVWNQEEAYSLNK